MKTFEPRPRDFKKKMVFGAAGASLFFHLGLFLLMGSAVIVEYQRPHEIVEGTVLPAEDLPPFVPIIDDKPLEPDSVDSSATPAVQRAEPVTLDQGPTIIEVAHVDTPVSFPPFFSPPKASGLDQEGAAKMPGLTDKTLRPSRIADSIGTRESFGVNSMEGILYDLKQSKDGKASGMTPEKYTEVVTEFFRKNWDRRLLESYYRVPKPLYNSQIYMPFMNAAEAPKAFQVEREVKPSQWVIYYEGSFQAPPLGAFRLAGYADDILVVRINGKTVLDASLVTIHGNKANPLVKVAGQEVMPAHTIANGCLVYSDWLRLSPGQTNKIEILVGERPGGQFCAFLFLEEKGRAYQKESNGRPVLPLFRIADLETKASAGAAFAPGGPIFDLKPAR